MPRIPSYPLIGSLSNNDLLVIDDVSQQYATKSVELQSLKGYFNTGQATTTYVDDKVVSGASFNTNTGVLTLTRTDGVGVTQNLDGRYALTSAVFSGNYNDLTNKPTIPTSNSQLVNGEGYTTNLGVVQSLTTDNSSGAATLENGTLNIPQYSGGGGGGEGTVTSIATTAPITGGTITNTGSIGISQASTDTDGYLSSANWTTFNNKQSTSEKGQTSGYAGLDANKKVPTANLPDSLVGAVVYKGTWDAASDIPTLPTPAAGNNGHYYIVSDAGTYSSITYAVGDWAISNGIAWEKVDNTQDVNSVFGRQGNIDADASDYSSFYDANVQSNWNVTDSNSDAFILNKPTTITQAQSNEIAANTLKTSFPEAPSNNSQYARQNGSWSIVSGGGGGIGGSGTDTQMAIFDSTSTITSTQAVAVNSSSQIIMDVLRSSTSYADDNAAEAGGVPYGGLYRTGSTVKINLLGSSPGPGSEVEICSLIWTTANSSETELITGGNIPILTTAAEMYAKYQQQQPAACYWQFNENESYRGLYYNLYARNVVKPPSGFRLPTNIDYQINLAGAECNSDRPNANRYAAPLPNNYNLTNTDFLGDSGFDVYGYGGAFAFSSTQMLWQYDTTYANFWTSAAANQNGSRMGLSVAGAGYLQWVSWAGSTRELAPIRFCKDA